MAIRKLSTIAVAWVVLVALIDAQQARPRLETLIGVLPEPWAAPGEHARDPAVRLASGCDLDTLRATLATLSPGELAAVGYVGDDGNWHALTAAALKGQ